jgi:23S rRNA (pseudouridine1915-N3)-methyltransferase
MAFRASSSPNVTLRLPLRITLISVGRIAEPSIRDACALYGDKIERYADFHSTVVREERMSARGKRDYILHQEGRRIREKIHSHAWIVTLDERGTLLTSPGFAQRLQEWYQIGRKEMVFIIGGPYGLEKPLKEEADFCLSLSNMTLAHGLAQVLLLEQIYRAFTILRGEPYHKS